jgi:hypothetical protein
MLRKHIVMDDPAGVCYPADEIDVSAVATVLVTSEDPEHPVENAFGGSRGRGGDCWIAGEDGEQSLILAFDAPQDIVRVALEVEEREAERRQEVTLSVSRDGGRTYRDLIRQEYNFSPQGSTFEREEWLLKAVDVTHLRLRIKPDIGGKPCRATVTSLAVG